MSWYVYFYLGIMDKDKKIRPFGPFNSPGELWRDNLYIAS